MRMKPTHHYRGRQHQDAGFSLIETAMVLLVMGLVASALLTLGTRAGESAKVEMTEARMDSIEKTLGAFYFRNGRLPCPARGAVRIGEESAGNLVYGVEATGADCTALRITSGGVDFYVGSLPIVTLGLSDENLIDGWNRRITYVVDGRFITSAVQLSATPPAPGTQPVNDGRLVVQGDGGTTLTNVTDANGVVVARGAAFLLISHGTNGVGAWPLQNPTGNSNRIYLPAAELSAFSTSRPGEENNAEVDPQPANNSPLSFDHIFSKLQRGQNFDDIVRYYMREDLIKLAGGIVDYELCMMASRATKEYVALITPAEGPIGCVDEGNATLDPTCKHVQTDMAMTLARLCMLAP